MASDSHDVFERVEREKESYLDELKDFLRIASISTKPEHRDDVLRGANWVRDSLTTAGVEAEIIETEGNPLVYGQWSGAPGKPTILFYGHYDVQPPEPLEEWRNPPFEPTVEGDLLVAARRDRRQGAAVRSRQGGRRDPRRARQPAGQREVPDRGRGGDRRRGDRQVRAR